MNTVWMKWTIQMQGLGVFIMDNLYSAICQNALSCQFKMTVKISWKVWTHVRSVSEMGPWPKTIHVSLCIVCIPYCIVSAFYQILHSYINVQYTSSFIQFYPSSLHWRAKGKWPRNADLIPCIAYYVADHPALCTELIFITQFERCRAGKKSVLLAKQVPPLLLHFGIPDSASSFEMFGMI